LGFFRGVLKETGKKNASANILGGWGTTRAKKKKSRLDKQRDQAKKGGALNSTERALGPCGVGKGCSGGNEKGGDNTRSQQNSLTRGGGGGRATRDLAHPK